MPKNLYELFVAIVCIAGLVALLYVLLPYLGIAIPLVLQQIIMIGCAVLLVLWVGRIIWSSWKP